MADYDVIQGIDVSALTETSFESDNDLLTLNNFVPTSYEFYQRRGRQN